MLGLKEPVSSLVELLGSHVHGLLHLARSGADKLRVAVLAQALITENLQKQRELILLLIKRLAIVLIANASRINRYTVTI